jgi:hypothetical protein
MNQLIKSKGLNFGLAYGFYLILLTLYAYVIDLSFFTSYWILGLVVIGFFVNGLWVIGSLKKDQNGFATFKEAFTVFFISNALALLLSTIVTILIFVVIDPELQETVKELTVIKTTETMEGFNVPMESIEIAAEEIRNQDNFSIAAQVKGYFTTLAISSVIGLLIALILKKKKEEEY